MEMNAEEIIGRLRRRPFWVDVQVHQTLSSTNDRLKALAREDAPHGTAVLALEQTSGRGRCGRRWHSPPGGLWLGALLRPPWAAEAAGPFSVLVAVALAEALRAEYGVPVQVKWPNDLLVGGRKLGGVLVELATQGPQIDWLIVGVGLNVNNPLPSEAETQVPPTSLAQELGQALRPLEGVAACTLDALASAYEDSLEGFSPVVARWERLSALPQQVEVQRGAERFRAQVLGLSPRGELIVETSQGRESLSAEEVRIRSDTYAKEGVL